MTYEISSKLSCGVLVVDSNDRLLLGHVTGKDWWDIPKGTQEDYEKQITTALREMEEESGIVVQEDDLYEIGFCHYNRYKDLWLYILYVDSVDLSKLKCRSTFTDNLTRCECPEIDDYKMVPLEEASEYMCGSLKRLFEIELHDDIIKHNTPNKVTLNYK